MRTQRAAHRRGLDRNGPKRECLGCPRQIPVDRYYRLCTECRSKARDVYVNTFTDLHGRTGRSR